MVNPAPSFNPNAPLRRGGVNPASSPNPGSPLRRGGVKTIPAVILLVGIDRYLKEKAINELRSSLLDTSCADLDYKVLHGEDASADEILASVSTVPFFSSKRLVVVKNFEKLSGEDTERLISYIKNPTPTTCLALDTNDAAILKDEPSIARYAKVVKFYGLAETEVSSWISRFVSSKGKAIEEEAIEIIKELQGCDLLNLSSELEKLITYTGGRKNIKVSDVEGLVGKSATASAFDIAHAVAKMDTAKAISIVHEISSYGKRPHEIIGLIAWHFKTLLKIKALIQEGRTEYSITEALRLPRKKAGEFFTQSASYSRDDIGAKLEILLEADLSIKRAKYSPSLILEFAVIRLCLG